MPSGTLGSCSQFRRNHPSERTNSGRRLRLLPPGGFPSSLRRPIVATCFFFFFLTVTWRWQLRGGLVMKGEAYEKDWNSKQEVAVSVATER